MAIWRFEDKIPQIGEGTFVAPTADVIGDVVIGSDCYVGPGARIRGDYGKIIIGDGCSIQENVVIHARPDEVTKVGSRVTMGHGCVLHNCIVEDNVVIGMRAVVSDYVLLKEWAIVGEGAVVSRGKTIRSGEIVVGIPAKGIGNIFDESKKEVREELVRFKDKYIEMAHRHLAEGALEKIA